MNGALRNGGAISQGDEMSLRVSTTGTDVNLKDLGLILAHPTTNLDLTLYFTDVELRDSVSLTSAIQGGTLIADDGLISIPATDYDPDETLLQSLGITDDSDHISHDELRSDGTYPVKVGAFPLAVNSTAAITKNIYVVAGHFDTWSVSAGDLVELTGNAASGVYTVDDIIDQQNLIVNEPILNSTGGFISIYHPAGAGLVGVSGLDLIQEDTVQGALKFIDENMITSSRHRDLDQLVHDISEDSFEEYTYSGNLVIQNTIWSNPSKITKIREYSYQYGIGNRISQIDSYQYDSIGSVVEHMIETFTYSGIRITSMNRELV